MKFTLFGLVLLTAAAAIGIETDPVVKNAGFSEWANGKPVGWTLRPGKNVRCAPAENGGLTLANGTLYQTRIKLEPGVVYDVGYSARGDGDAELMLAVEWNLVRDGKRIGGRTHGGNWSKPGAEWREHRYRFTFSTDDTAGQYIVLKSRGTVQVRNLTIRRVAKLSELGGVWKLNNAAAADAAGAITVPGRSTAELAGVQLIGGKRYELSFAAIGIGASDQISGYHRFRLRIRFANLSSFVSSEVLEVFSAMTQRKSVIFTVPGDAAFGGVGSFTFQVLGKSRIKFSHLALTEAAVAQEAKYRIELTDPSFRNTIFASRPIDSITGVIPVDAEIKSAELTFDGNPTALERRDDKYVFTVPATGLAEGEHRLAAKLVTADGKSIIRETVVRKLPPAPGEVVCDRTRIYVNGEPFFPVTMYYLHGRKAMQYLASRGFNSGIATFAFPTADKLLEVLDNAAATGFKMLLAINLPEPNKPDSEYARWHACVEKALTDRVVNHPALLGWYLADEPAWGGISHEKLTKVYRKLAELDPRHPCFICEAPRGTLEIHQRYAQAADIFGIDVYPIPYIKGVDDHRPDTILRYTRFASSAVNGRKPLLMVLQGFSWNDMTNTPNRIYPTRMDLRHAGLSALAGGAGGMAFYGHNHVYRPDFYETFFAATDDLNRMLPFFTAGGECKPLESGVPGIELYHLRRGGCEAYLALNTGDKKLSADFMLPGAVDADCPVAFENRSVQVRNGRLRDEFAPGDAHVYMRSELPEPYVKAPPFDGENPYVKNAAARAARRKAGQPR